tara:strand:+ start:2086 stop:3060 length:975 start_codon:yes stop_codon:yes gene_type:complete
MQSAEEKVDSPTTLPTPVVEEAPSIPASTPEAQETIWGEIEAAGNDDTHNHLFCGVVGHEGTCKSGIVLDSLTDEEAARGDVILCVDFDGGAAAIRSAYHRNRLSNIRVLSPWVMQTGDRTAYDYPETHNRVMEIGRAAIDWAEKQTKEDYSGPRLHSLLVTALDLWNSVATNCMKIIDLDAAPDGIAAVVNPQKLVGNRWNWQIRSTRFHQLTAICRRLMTLGVRVYWETHLNVEYENNKETGKHRPDWEKQTNNYLNQIIWMHKVTGRDDDGQPTGETRYEAEFYKSKTNINLQGQRRVVAVTRASEPAEWYGLSELREGLL